MQGRLAANLVCVGVAFSLSINCCRNNIPAICTGPGVDLERFTARFDGPPRAPSCRRSSRSGASLVTLTVAPEPGGGGYLRRDGRRQEKEEAQRREEEEEAAPNERYMYSRGVSGRGRG